MVKRKRNIVTNNREIYEKFNMLYFSPEIILTDVKQIQVEKILKNINKDDIILDMKVSNKILFVKKIKPLNFNLYLR